MHKLIAAIALGYAALAGSGASAQAPARAAPEIWRLDCGEIHVNNLDVFSDAFLYVGRQKTLTASCYLIRNGDRYLLWDTGVDGALAGRTVEEGVFRISLREQIRDQLARINVRPEQVTFVGISHYHDDHTGQAADFSTASLVIGRLDWEAIRTRPPTAARFRPWIEGGGTVIPVGGDRDIFGDGSAVMLNMPGHTPGHHVLLVRLRGRNLLLTGDLYHFTEQVRNSGVPSFNTDRADTLASFARFQAIARSLRAQIIIQHEPNDIRLLPAFPQSAR